MKKFLFAAAIAAFGFVNTNAQETGFEASVYAGIPTGDFGDSSGVNIGATVAYYFGISENFKVGILTGYDTFTGKDQELDILGQKITIDGESTGFIPVAASAKYDFGSIFIGADLGYAIYAGKGDGKGGFLYRPRVGYSATSFDIYGFYKGISNKVEVEVAGNKFSENSTAGSVGLGFAYKF